MIYYDQINIEKELERIFDKSNKWVINYEKQNWLKIYSILILKSTFFVLLYSVTWFLLINAGKINLLFALHGLVLLVIFLRKIYEESYENAVFNYSINEAGEKYLNSKKSIKKIQHCLQNNDFDSVKYYMAYLCIYYNDYDYSLKLLNQIKGDEFKDKGFFKFLAEVNLGLKNYEEALKAFEEELRIFPLDEDLMLDYVDILIQEQKFKKAKNVLLDFKDKGLLSYLKLGGVCESLGELDESIINYRKWIEGNKRNPMAKRLEQKIKYMQNNKGRFAC